MTALLALSLLAAPPAGLPRSSPEEQGVRSAAVLDFVRAADTQLDSLHSLMVVRHGHVVAEGWWAPYAADTRHQLYSLSKSFTSTAVGIAQAEGRLSADDPVLKFFPDLAPASPPAYLKAMRLTDLLRMNTGHQTEPPRKPDEPWARTFLAHPLPFKPGTHFLYNTSATYMLSAAVQQATGQTLLDYLKPRLFDPLGIENPTWEASPQGVSAGGYGLSVRTEDIAKFGQLYLQKGQWQGQQLVPAAWVAAATARQTSNGSSPASDWDQGYGYQFWRCRHGAYRGDGAFGQYCVVLPEQDAVVAVTSGVRDLQAVLNLVWDKLLPAFAPAARPADAATQAELATTLRGLSLAPPTGDHPPPAVAGKTFRFPANPGKLEWLRVEPAGPLGPNVLLLKADGVERRVVCGRNTWARGRAAWGRLPEQPTAAAGNWTAADSFAVKLCFVETPFVVTLRLTFGGEEVRLVSETNVGFGATKDAPLVGKAEPAR